ncbi:hypothetical protein [Moorena producens]|uniref:hypothetical protein n=1 Tax=Moorena producens TaxID=1155739 RepID=UPI003C747BD2
MISSEQEQVVTGYAVQQAVFGGGGKKLGAYFQTGPNGWKEVNAQGQTTFEFVEVNRDEWSVYMNDSSRGVSIQIDLYRKKVRYSDRNTPWRDLYEVLSATPVVGWLVQQAVFGSGANTFGRFRQETGANNWQELNAQGTPVFEFLEFNRDDWSVYMNDSYQIRSKNPLYNSSILSPVLLCSCAPLLFA